jgi:hypothetical protein
MKHLAAVPFLTLMFLAGIAAMADESSNANPRPAAAPFAIAQKGDTGELTREEKRARRKAQREERRAANARRAEELRAANRARAAAARGEARSGPPIPVTELDSRLDMVGIRLGMSPDEAETAIRSHDPSLTMIEEDERDLYTILDDPVRGETFIARRWYRTPDRSELVVVELPPPPVAPQLMKIWRYQTFSKGQRPLLTSVYEALVGKYGQPSFEGESMLGRTYSWHLGPDGKPDASPATRERCRDNSAHWTATPRGQGDLRQRSSTIMEFRKGHPLLDCGVVLTAFVQTDREYVTAMGTTLVNYAKHRAIIAELKEEASGEKAAARDREREAARSVEAPSL